MMAAQRRVNSSDSHAISVIEQGSVRTVVGADVSDTVISADIDVVDEGNDDDESDGAALLGAVEPGLIGEGKKKLTGEGVGELTGDGVLRGSTFVGPNVTTESLPI